MSKQKGFSIVEILVALGIIGLITAVSVPNYTKMKRAAKKAEAQSSLGQLYISEKNFFLQWRTYTVDLIAIGAVPEGALTYNVGFEGAGTLTTPSLASDYRGPQVKPENNNFGTICGQDFEGTSGTVKQCAFTYKKQGKRQGFQPPDIPKKTKDGKDCNATKDEFVACAIANLISKSNTSHKGKEDKWSINQYKVVQRECDRDKGKCPY